MDNWEAPRMEAYMWWCGSDHCDCQQPRIDYITPDRRGGFPRVNRQNVWSGTYDCDGEEMDLQFIELEQTAGRFGIQLNEHHCGHIAWP